MWYVTALQSYPSCPAYNCDVGPPYENVYDKAFCLIADDLSEMVFFVFFLCGYSGYIISTEGIGTM
jgi:hypothetical protein